ncbi:patatin-like phospholipase family protein [Shewanella sp. 202IG2-18]|uniref:patatin-like phospholipase family protein n=1 Tax=Parashewanella hymeniacidonis TaxID=2807618 RepID=UPI0019600370|nr:patatin-like phospholipase family protein [Parashewanella hymeniacidonis]MBM7070763.1 patatin-like phospholipase family protein [Parashewanella hymeniacidonis]
MEAIRASCTFPSLFNPVLHEGRWLLDGGLVNPAPVSLCRAFGADVVIAVDLNTQLVGRHALFETPEQKTADKDEKRDLGKIEIVKNWLTPSLTKNKDEHPGLLDVITASINIMQDRITHSRMADDPPDILLSPRVNDIGMLDFGHAQEAIDEGVIVTQNTQKRILDLCGVKEEVHDYEIS